MLTHPSSSTCLPPFLYTLNPSIFNILFIPQLMYHLHSWFHTNSSFPLSLLFLIHIFFLMLYVTSSFHSTPIYVQLFPRNSFSSSVIFTFPITLTPLSISSFLMYTQWGVSVYMCWGSAMAQGGDDSHNALIHRNMWAASCSPGLETARQWP